jgi:imidazoleglycerol-phosphate dehydratase
MKNRTASVSRETKETNISVTIRLDGPQGTDIETPLPFMTHMLDSFACHGRFGLEMKATGDIEVDPHHLVEDCGIMLGSAVAKALETFDGIQRAGFFTYPMDGSLATVALDLCGRPNLVWNVELQGEPLAGTDPALFRDLLKGFADSMRATLHVNAHYSDGDHHVLEAVFKALGRALNSAVQPLGEGDALSTKGKIDA